MEKSLTESVKDLRNFIFFSLTGYSSCPDLLNQEHMYNVIKKLKNFDYF